MINIYQRGWLKLQAYRQHNIQKRTNQKLAHQYYGSFQVLAPIGKVAYKLKLPQDAKIHDTFHVSQLKKFRGSLPIVAHIPDWFHGVNPAETSPQAAAVLQTRMVKFQNSPQVQYLVRWVGFEDHEATWESDIDFEARYSSFIVQT